MFISVIKKMLPYVITSVVCLIISLVYTHFSHEITSIYMSYACVIPLAAGIIRLIFNRWLNNTIYRASWITLLTYSYMRGVIEIYGTTNIYLPIFLYVSIGMLLLSIVIVEKKKAN